MQGGLYQVYAMVKTHRTVTGDFSILLYVFIPQLKIKITLTLKVIRYKESLRSCQSLPKETGGLTAM
jgi:hypothetical protein